MNENYILDREKNYIDQISDQYNYDSNIRHLLYIMIPAFIMKYGMNKEKLILNTFRDIQIIKSNKESKQIKAYFSSMPKKINNEFITKKYMVIYNYQDIGLIDLLDNLVHEFNHAINSYVNEIRTSKKYLYLRTGLTYRVYKIDNLAFVKKDNSFILEEIINTKQTSDIINIIKKFQPNDTSIQNTIYAINAETNHSYNSESYYLQSYICKEILNNRTFLPTMENLRINGEIYDIEKWFDDIMGEDGKYRELINCLKEVYDLEIQYVERKIFKGILRNRIRDKSRDIMRLIERFNQNVNFR